MKATKREKVLTLIAEQRAKVFVFMNKGVVFDNKTQQEITLGDKLYWQLVREGAITRNNHKGDCGTFPTKAQELLKLI